MSSPDSTFSPQVFHIMLALAGGPAHGYAIMQAVEEETAGEVVLGPGTLYGAVRRLRSLGLIEETREAAGAAEGRRYYRLTPQGRQSLRREAERLERLVDAARARRLLPVQS